MPLLYNPTGDPTGMGATALSNAVATWSGAPGTSYRDAYAGTSSATGDTGGIDRLNVVYWPHPWPYGNTGEVLAVTEKVFNPFTCDILDADVAINDNFQWTTAGGSGADLQSVLTHELGHVAGLEHVMDPNAVMYPAFQQGNRRQLGQEDIFAIDALYPGPRTYVITGNHVGDITVPPRSTVIVNNANVTGGVHVSAGTALDVENSTISGGLGADSAAAVRVCGSSIGTSVKVTSARDFVLIGDSGDDGCALNSIGDSLILQDNTNGIDAVSNQVTGAVIASGNSGAGPDRAGPEITPQAPASRFTTINVPGAIATIPNAISPTGAIVGVFVDSSGTQHGFLDQAGTFTTIDAPGSDGPSGGTVADGISPAGAIVGFFVDSSGTQHGFLDQGGTFTTIDAPDAAPGPSGGTLANGISPSGAIVGVYGDSSGNAHGFLDQGGTFTTIDAPDADGSSGGTYANAINAGGAIVGYFFDSSGGIHGFLDQAGTFTAIDAPGAILTFASGISPTGAIVGYYYDSSFIRHGFLDQGGTFTTIDVPGARPTLALGISPTGAIVGKYRRSGGPFQGFLLKPAPSTTPPP